MHEKGCRNVDTYPLCRKTLSSAYHENWNIQIEDPPLSNTESISHHFLLTSYVQGNKWRHFHEHHKRKSSHHRSYEI